MKTRPKPAYDRQGQDWIVRPEYSFGVFSKSRLTPTALSSVLFKEMIIFRDTDKQTFFVIHWGSKLGF